MKSGGIGAGRSRSVSAGAVRAASIPVKSGGLSKAAIAGSVSAVKSGVNRIISRASIAVLGTGKKAAQFSSSVKERAVSLKSSALSKAAAAKSALKSKVNQTISRVSRAVIGTKKKIKNSYKKRGGKRS